MSSLASLGPWSCPVPPSGLCSVNPCMALAQTQPVLHLMNTEVECAERRRSGVTCAAEITRLPGPSDCWRHYFWKKKKEKTMFLSQRCHLSMAVQRGPGDTSSSPPSPSSLLCIIQCRVSVVSPCSASSLLFSLHHSASSMFCLHDDSFLRGFLRFFRLVSPRFAGPSLPESYHASLSPTAAQR